jgi:hypothetical protein
MSVDDHWEIAVEIPIAPLSGAVQSVTGSAVDNTDPLNPVVNLSGATPNLQQVTDVVPDGNKTTNPITAFGYYVNGASTERIISDETGVLVSWGDMQIRKSVTEYVSFNPGSLTVGRGYILPDKDGTLAMLDDITGSGGYTVVSSNLTAVNDTNYTVVANATFTDPSPTEGKGYIVYVRNGTATIGGTGYAVGSLVFRVFHSGAWSSREYKSNLTASDIPTGVDATKIADGSVSNTEFQYINSLSSNAQAQIDNRVRTLLNDNVDSSSVTGTVANTILKSYLIPANTLAVGDTIDFKAVCSKTGTNANSIFRLYTNTSVSLLSASVLGTITPNANNVYFSLDRTYTLKSGNILESFPVAQSAVTDEATNNVAISNTAFNPAVDNYFIVAIQPNSASDSFVQTLCYITLMKSKTTI